MTKESIMGEFLAFTQLHEVQLLKIFQDLQTAIHHELPDEIKRVTENVLAQRAYVALCSAKYNELLDRATQACLPTKAETGLGELDRKVMCKAEVAPIQYWCDICDGLLETIDRRISFSQSELAFEKEYVKKIGESYA